MRRRTATTATIAAGSAVALLGLGAPPAVALDDPVSIEVRISSSTSPDADKTVYRVDDVVVGDGPELTAADLVQQSDQCGSVDVDIDPEARTITIASTDLDCTAGLISVFVDSDELTVVDIVTNELASWDPGVHPFFEIDSEFGAAWLARLGETMTLSGQSVFLYEPTPTPSPDPSPTPTSVPAPTAAPAPTPQATVVTAPPATPVTAKADFTG